MSFSWKVNEQKQGWLRGRGKCVMCRSSYTKPSCWGDNAGCVLCFSWRQKQKPNHAALVHMTWESWLWSTEGITGLRILPTLKVITCPRSQSFSGHCRSTALSPFLSQQWMIRYHPLFNHILLFSVFPNVLISWGLAAQKTLLLPGPANF